MPVLLREFAKKLLGDASVNVPLADLRERLTNLDATACEEAERMFIAVHPANMHDCLLRYVNALLERRPSSFSCSSKAT